MTNINTHVLFDQLNEDPVQPNTALGAGSGQPAPPAGTSTGPSGISSLPSTNDFLNAAQATVSGGTVNPTLNAGNNPGSGGITDVLGLGNLAGNTQMVYTGMSAPGPSVTAGGDVTVGRGARPGTQTKSPQYIDPPTYVTRILALPASAFTQYQKELAKAGLYGNNQPLYGVPSAADTQALNGLLSSYLPYVVGVQADGGTPMTPEQYLNKYSAQLKKQGGATSTQRAPLSLTDPAAIRQSAMAAAQASLGHDLTDAQLKKFISEYHAAETKAYNTAGANKTYTPPDLSGQADVFAENVDPEELQSHRMAGFVDQLNNMLGVL